MAILITAIGAIIIALFIWWNVSFPFYKDRVRHTLVSNEEKCFSNNCRSIKKDNGSDTVFFFIHGYPTAPNMYRWTCEHLSSLGYDVQAPLIPTFGADPDEFAETNYSEWYEFIKKEYLKARRSHEHCHVVGVSMGGATALKLSEDFSDTPDEMDTSTVIAAPVTYNSFLQDRIVTDFKAYFVRTVALFAHKIKPGIVDGIPGKEDGEDEWTGYRGIYPRNAASFIYNLRAIRRDLEKITVPILSIHDRGDTTVPFANQEIIVDNIKARRVKRIVSEMPDHGHSKHSLLMYHSTREEVTEDILDFIKGDGK